MRTIAPIWLTGAGALVASAAATVLVLAHHDAATKVLGEKITGTGTSSGSTQAGAANGPQPNKPSGNPNNGGKTFTIAGTVDGLYPGGTVQLQLSVTNALNQDMNVTDLSASLASILKDATAPAGTCSPGLTIGKWTGSTFRLPKNTTNQLAPGYIPVSMAKSASDACEGATFNFTYAGRGAQA